MVHERRTDLNKFLIEAVARIDEQAHITGRALIPRISRNNNLYTKAELERFDNVTVPLNWEHDKDKKIGQVTFHYNPTLETVYYDGYVTDEAYANLVRNKILFTSIEAEPISQQTICNGSNDCFNMPFGLVPEALALTEAPGVPETSVTVIESWLKEDADCVKKMMDAGHSKADADKACYDKDKMGYEKKLMEPFANYKDFADCVAKNSDKDDPQAYCGHIKAQAETLKENEEIDKLKQELSNLKKIITCPTCGGIKKTK